MRPIALIALFLLIGLLWNIAPGKTLSEMLAMTGAGAVATDRARQARFGSSPLPATECVSCHAQYFEEWSGSAHARSLTSENFLRAFSQYLESLGMQGRQDAQAAMACFSCHAPLLTNADPQLIHQVTGFVLARQTNKLEGFEVGCVACHSAGSQVFSGPIRDAQDNPFHLSKYSTSYKVSSFCATCHTSGPSSVPCSDVYSDYRKSRAAKQGATCQSCHMAKMTGFAASGGPPRQVHNHAFPGSRSAAMLQQAVRLRLKAAFRKDRLEVTATVRNLAPHRVPDG
jgi:Cytochrome c554 and c-prime